MSLLTEGELNQVGELFVDRSAELVVLLSGDEAENYRVLSIVRISGFRRNAIKMLIRIGLEGSVGASIREEMKERGATAYGFLNKEEFEGILAGTSSSPLGDILKKNNFSEGFSIKDIEI